ncbi:YEATS-associated helix-containing protein [Chryseobacterium vaccae]|uniref:YEATS-associated helix-containing protein n=1 Tax=Chryseobacterium vaccae TaxID=2604424 RepID=UPI00129699FB|nr:YEATS-associated helix-containing protein [Chryseobacterium vaccae]
MDLSYITLIMLFTGILGGVVNYYSDANKQTGNESTVKLRSKGVCILFGIAATILVPLFLKFAESKLLDGIRLHDKASQSEQKSPVGIKAKPAAHVMSKSDSLQSKPQIKEPITAKQDQSKSTSEENSLASDYLIWTAYCLLAACAGMRFIDLLMSRVISKEYIKQAETTINEQNKEIKDLKKESVIAENNYKVSEPLQLQMASQASVLKSGISTGEQSKMLLSQLPPITHANDPQKGRFGGKNNVNGKTLSVDYDSYIIPGFLNLTIKVSADEGELTSDVYLFLHNSFARSIIHLEGYGKKEVEYKIPSYGAFTIGAILDNGDTLLELDIAELKNFPESFRNR